MEFNKRIRHSEEKCKLALDLLSKGLSVEDLSRRLNIPATTIKNWKLGYTKVYGRNKKLDSKDKVKIQYLVNLGHRIKNIAKILDIPYNTVRLFLKKSMNCSDYEQIKITAHKISKEAKELNADLAYILGVMLGDGYFAAYQFNLDTIDKDFRDYFSQVVEKWSNKKPSSLTN